MWGVEPPPLWLCHCAQMITASKCLSTVRNYQMHQHIVLSDLPVLSIIIIIIIIIEEYGCRLACKSTSLTNTQ